MIISWRIIQIFLHYIFSFFPIHHYNSLVLNLNFSWNIVRKRFSCSWNCWRCERWKMKLDSLIAIYSLCLWVLMYLENLHQFKQLFLLRWVFPGRFYYANNRPDVFLVSIIGLSIKIDEWMGGEGGGSCPWFETAYV